MENTVFLGGPVVVAVLPDPADGLSVTCGGDAIEAISAANLKLIENSNADMFVTVWLGVVNLVDLKPNDTVFLCIKSV